MPLSTIATLIGGHELGKAVARAATAQGWRKIIAVPATATNGSSSAVTQSGAGPLVTLSGNPLCHYKIKVEILLGGARGTATFRYSLDDGYTWSGTIATAATYLMYDGSFSTGVTLNFATGTNYVLGEIYSATSTGPTVSTTNLGTAMTALRASGHDFDCVIVLTTHAGATDADRSTAWSTYYGAAVTEINAMFSANKPAFIVIPGPGPVSTATPSDITTWGNAFRAAALAVTRNRQVISVGGPGLLTDSIGGKLRTLYPTLIQEAARKLGSEALDHDLGARGQNGEYALEASPVYDEYAFALLDDASIVTTVFDGQWFFSAGRTHSIESFYDRICNVRIANLIYRLARRQLQTWLNEPIKRNKADDVADNDALILNAPSPAAAAHVGANVSAYVNQGVRGLTDGDCSFVVDQTYASNGLRGEVVFPAKNYTESITFTVVAE
jgi:hypothetical protein